MRALEGGVALITGGAVRVGRAFTEGLASRGMRVAIHYNASRAEADALRDALRTQHHDAECFGADLLDADAAAALPDRVARHFGKLDVLVNSAAIMHRLTVAETTVAQWDRILDLNLRAPFLIAQHAAPHLAKAHGTIVNIADLAGLEPWPTYAAHSVSKAGVVMLTQVLARALAPDVTVNAIAPGAVLPPDDFTAAQRQALEATTPLHRLGTPDDAVQALLYLVEQGDFVTGETLVVDGGRRWRR